MEALSANIKKVERQKQLTRMKVSRACPSVLHLLFANDIFFFFGKAQRVEALTIIRILKKYEAVSGQLISFDKSSIQVGFKIEDTARQELRNILGIQNLGGTGSYLGLPESLVGSKVHVFDFSGNVLPRELIDGHLKFSLKEGKK